MVIKIKFAALAATLVLCVAPGAMAHDANEIHDQAHDSLDAQHSQIHQLVNDGLISPQEHSALDARLSNEHQNLHNNLNGYNNNSGYFGNGDGGYSNGYGNGYGNNYSNGYGNNGYGNNGYSRWNQHRGVHQALRAEHKDIHRLVDQGVISPQEHAALDANLRAQHQQADNNLNNQNLNFAQRARRWW